MDYGIFFSGMGVGVVITIVAIAALAMDPGPEETGRIETYAPSRAPGLPLTRSRARMAVVRDGKGSVQEELDRIRGAEGAGFPNEAA